MLYLIYVRYITIIIQIYVLIPKQSIYAVRGKLMDVLEEFVIYKAFKVGISTMTIYQANS